MRNSDEIAQGDVSRAEVNRGVLAAGVDNFTSCGSLRQRGHDECHLHLMISDLTYSSDPPRFDVQVTSVRIRVTTELIQTPTVCRLRMLLLRLL